MADGAVRDRELEGGAVKEASLGKEAVPDHPEGLRTRNTPWVLLAPMIAVLIFALVVLVMLVIQSGRPAAPFSGGLYVVMMCGVMLGVVIAALILFVALRIHDQALQSLQRIEDVLSAIDRVEGRMLPKEEVRTSLSRLENAVDSEFMSLAALIRERFKVSRRPAVQSNLPATVPPPPREPVRESPREPAATPGSQRFELPAGETDALLGYEADATAAPADDPNAGVRSNGKRPPSDMLMQVQRCAANAFTDAQASDEQQLTQVIHAWGRTTLFAKLVPELQVCAHNSTKQLAKDFRDPDFISVVRKHDLTGWLLPNPRAQYAGTHTGLYGGEKENWPDFSQPAECSVDGSGKATLVRKGVL